MSDYAKRFSEIKIEAQAEMDAARAKVLALMAEAEIVLDEMRAKGIYIRCEMPPVSNNKLTTIRILSEWRFEL